ncbi:hypothetical protein [Virgisporangium aurantiacum]|uniref:Uncharacterized protein n=1 Tax=Virgisporangium aurantiacum TaxID=175570 RepID=A0A8J3Z9V2_9ACTN|nr:hypothetical protein [Virgisporangium aurantiacum]GIJ57816.1 hypothetical protein Vau01_053320 [Virgisporangium aurantiacum]
MNEIDVLHDVFGPDELPSATAHDRARSALLDRISNPGPVRRRSHWALRATAVVTAAAAVAVGVVVISTVTDDEPRGTGQATGRPAADAATPAAAPPYARPAGAAEFLENVAWAAGRRPWVTPRPDQFMYVEVIATVNQREISDAEPNGALVPGKTETLRREHWNRVDGQVISARENGGRINTIEQARRIQYVTYPCAALFGLDTPEKFDAWKIAPKSVDANVEALLMYCVLPPVVEAAIYRWLARQPGVQIDPDAANLDGRPAIALTFHQEDYLRQDMLFDPTTYAMIGERLVAFADHVAESLDATRHIKAGDVFRLQVRGRGGIVDNIGDLP